MWGALFARPEVIAGLALLAFLVITMGAIWLAMRVAEKSGQKQWQAKTADESLEALRKFEEGRASELRRTRLERIARLLARNRRRAAGVPKPE